MEILPAVTLPPSKPLAYQHTPPRSEDYHSYRNCLRWEFGFSCPFCLTHEADAVRSGASESLGLTGIEHILPQSSHKNEKTVYTNCVYCCQMCNRARSNKPSVEKPGGRKLLNPTQVAWSQHFYSSADKLLPNPVDSDAKYTHEAYNINDPRKVSLRKTRRVVIQNHLAFIKSDPDSKIALLIRTARNPSLTQSERENLVRAAHDLRRYRDRVYEDLRTYAGEPADAPKRCRCNVTTYHVIPQVLKSQLIHIN